MNWDQLEGNWKQFKGKMKETWGKITDDDFETIAGKKDRLMGVIQEKYGIAKDEAEKQLSAFGDQLEASNDDLKKKLKSYFVNFSKGTVRCPFF